MCQLAGARGVDVVDPVPQNPEQDGEGGDGGAAENQAPGADDAAGAVQHLLGLLRQASVMPPRGAAAPADSIVIQTGSRLNTVDSVLASGSTLMAEVGFDTVIDGRCCLAQ